MSAVMAQAQVPADNISRSAALTQEAASLLIAKDYMAAFTLASKATELNPRNAQAWNYRAISHNKSGRFAEAYHDANAALELVPDNSLLLYSKAFALAGMGEGGAALFALKRCARLDPRFLPQYEQALQIPETADLLSIFEEPSPVLIAEPQPPDSPPGPLKRYLKLALLSLSGGILVALGLLNLASASWKEKIKTTVRLASSRIKNGKSRR